MDDCDDTMESLLVSGLLGDGEVRYSEVGIPCSGTIPKSS